MEGDQVEIFVHAPGARPIAVVAGRGEVLRDVLARFDIIDKSQNDVLVFVGECEEALDDAADATEDKHVPVDIDLSLEKLDLQRHRHVHCHRCRHIAVEVQFGGKTKRRRFSPATAIRVVTHWARRVFDLDPAAASEYVLRVCHSTDQPRADKHLGELAEVPTCSVCFDLVKEITPQG